MIRRCAFMLALMVTAAFAQEQKPTLVWSVYTITINGQAKDCEFNSTNNLYYFMGRDGVVAIEDSCIAAVNKWAITFPPKLLRARLDRSHTQTQPPSTVIVSRWSESHQGGVGLGAALSLQEVGIQHIRWTIRAEVNMPIVTIDGVDWHTAGFTYCDRHEIIYDPTANDLHTTIIHELLHAASCRVDNDYDNFYWNSADEDHHAGFERIAHFTANLLRENPQLARWLVGR